MSISNSILGLAVLGVGGYLVYTMLKKRGADEEADIISQTPMSYEDATAEYSGAVSDWAERFVGETMPDGSQIFQPLDVSPTNPLRMYYAVVKKHSWKPMGKQTWDIFNKAPGTIAEIFLFNTVTKREVSLYELAKSEFITPDAKKSVEETFANAFVFACKVWPLYNPWDNTYGRYGSQDMAYLRNDCSDRYETGL